MTGDKKRVLFLKAFIFWIQNILSKAAIPLSSILFAFCIGSIILLLSGSNPIHAYAALFQGSLGSLTSISRSLDKATPLLFSGLAIAFAFRAGLFNIGAQGQLILGALAAGIAGYSIHGLPFYIHIPICLLAGAAAGAFYSIIQGFLKAYTGAHEVITGIMLNYVAINITDYISSGPCIDRTSGNIISRTPAILTSAHLPYFNAISSGFILGVLFALTLWFFLKYTTGGFVIRTVGLNAFASKYAGIRVQRVIVVTMLLSGMFAGIGGAIETQAVVFRFQPGFNVGLGFEGITIALLGRTHPLGIVFASILFGGMKAGASQMQFVAGVPPEIIDVIAALILFFVAADVMIRKIFRLKETIDFKMALTTGWCKQ